MLLFRSVAEVGWPARLVESEGATRVVAIKIMIYILLHVNPKQCTTLPQSIIISGGESGRGAVAPLCPPPPPPPH